MKLLTALDDFSLARVSEVSSRLEEAMATLQSLEANLPATDKAVLETVHKLTDCLVKLSKWIQCSLDGEPNPERFLNAAKAQALVVEELMVTEKFSVFFNQARKVINQIKAVNQFNDVKAVVLELSKTSLPLLCLAEEERSWRINAVSENNLDHEEERNEGPFVIKAMFEIDHQPWSNPQAILAETLYDLHAKITIPIWPTNADFLIIDYISSLSPEQYRIAQLCIDRPQQASTQEFTSMGHVEFPIAQSLLSEPIVIRVRAAFHSSRASNEPIPATVIGYHQLRVSVSTKAQAMMPSGYQAIDARTLEIVSEIRQSLPSINPQHLNDFCEALASLANFMGSSLQSARYREGVQVSEADFQKDILSHMRTQFGEQVEEAPRQAGGPTDIKFKSVTIELKVEDTISSRRKMIEKYWSQITQYSSGSGAQLGILCILDLTQKQHPPANPQNQISLETPPVHGFTSDNISFPTKIAAVVIDGNLRLPSSYSR